MTKFGAKNKSMTVLAILLSSSAVSGSTLCGSVEKVIFSCEVNDGKMVSFCRSDADNALIYRYGTLESVELEHRDAPGPHSTFFYGETRSRFQSAHSVGMTRGKYRYEAYRMVSNENDDGATYSLIVTTPTRKNVKVCLRNIQDVSLDTTHDVYCDANDMHGCGKWQNDSIRES